MVRPNRVKQYGTGIITPSASAATSTSTEKINGMLKGVYVNLGTATSVDVSIVVGELTVFTETSITSDTYYPVRGAVVNESGDAITNDSQEIPLNGIVVVTLANVSGAGGAGTVTVSLYYV